jgi:iron complex transport system substrate-binding protein
MNRAIRTLAAASAALTLLVACGDDAGDSADTTTAPDATAEAFPATVDAANGEVTIEAAPERIVSLFPTATETLFAIGAGDQVEAADVNSDYPDGVPTTDLSGLEPNVEALLAYEPDLVVIDNENPEVLGALGDLDIPVLVQPAATNFDDVYEQMDELGVATGHADEAEALAADTASRIEELSAQVTGSGEPLTYYHELDDTYYTATSSTFIGEVYGAVGLENIADEADDGSGYPQLSAEYIIDADPDLIFLADTECCGQSPETVAQRPGWDTLSAVTGDGVVPLDDDIVSRWGPRVVDFLEVVVDAVEQVTAA